MHATWNTHRLKNACLVFIVRVAIQFHESQSSFPQEMRSVLWFYLQWQSACMSLRQLVDFFLRLLCSSLRLLAWLMATACLCGGISSDEHPAFVLTHLKEDATIIQIPFTTDTEVASNSKPNGYELTINGNIPGSGYNINGSQVSSRVFKEFGTLCLGGRSP